MSFSSSGSDWLEQILRQAQAAASGVAAGGPGISLSLSLSGNRRVTARVRVSDAAGRGQAGVHVDGQIRIDASGVVRSLRFPPTDAAGWTEVSAELAGEAGSRCTCTVAVRAGGSVMQARQTLVC
ncbi:MAG TPA: hypothetical protein VKV26_13265 [Dehalococcoidia bacterium]|nr:hypothetical protein [Dehalococcoidia bacterium]